MDGFRGRFSGLEDPRTGNARRHDLSEILMIALCTALCGGDKGSNRLKFNRAGWSNNFLRKLISEIA